MGTRQTNKRRRSFRPVLTAIYVLTTLPGLLLLFCFFLACDLALLTWAFLPAAMFVVVAVHELGHAIAALLCRWRLVVVAAWPVAIQAWTGRLIVDANVSTRDGGGFVASVPRKRRTNTRLRYAIICAGGPVASLLVGGICIGAALLVLPAWVSTQYYDGFGVELPDHIAFFPLLGFGLLSSGSGLASLVPVVREDYTSDGAQMLQFLRKERRQHPAGLVMMLLNYNVRLRDIPKWMYDDARADMGMLLEPSLHDAWDIGRSLDARAVDAVRARELIERFRVKHGESDWLAACDCLCAALHEGQPERARAAITARRGDGGPKQLVLAAEAAVAGAAGDIPLMNRKLQMMKAALKEESPYPNQTYRDIARSIERLATQPRALRAELAPA